jgi:hypothetical protein
LPNIAKAADHEAASKSASANVGGSMDAMRQTEGNFGYLDSLAA